MIHRDWWYMHVIYTTNDRLCLSMNEQWYSGWGGSRTGERKDQVKWSTLTPTHMQERTKRYGLGSRLYFKLYVQVQEGFHNYAVWFFSRPLLHSAMHWQVYVSWCSDQIFWCPTSESKTLLCIRYAWNGSALLHPLLSLLYPDPSSQHEVYYVALSSASPNPPTL